MRLIALPGAFGGQAVVTATAQLYGTELGGIARLYETKKFQFDLTGGARYVELSEGLGVSDVSVVLQGGVASFNGRTVNALSTTGVSDVFQHAQTSFYGGYVGGKFWYDCCPFFISFAGRVGVGDMYQSLSVNGSSLLYSGSSSVPARATGGLLATPSNIGHFTQDRFAVVPEGELKIACRVTHWLTIYTGYNFLYMSDVTRPDNDIDRGINSSRVPVANNFGVRNATARPLPMINSSDFFAHGLAFGMAFVY